MHKILTICGISRLTLQISKYGFLVDFSFNVVQDQTIPSTSSISGHLDMGIGEDNQYFRIFMDLECGFGGHSLDLRMVWFWGIGNSFVFWLNGENKNSLDL
ncbi:hypothetical protein RCL_jg10747.t2 [Rhizophagus clarus]|uniref:Uncharacterized protein n=1 Tax=Rhizophagus clarus TaxID=94130 RepID=A0A8H3L9C2_9GLOM|nr:hypothetical protein RCL_jg10747.t2 [Rhizophagus clarus]